MNGDNISVREISKTDLPLIIDYWLTSDKSFMEGMGVDISKIPSREKWNEMLSEQLDQPYREKKSYCMIWLLNHIPVGHSNVNKIIFGQEAYMHIHIWKPEIRKMGLGETFAKQTIPYFFKNLQLQKLLCEPYALNPAPNNLLRKLGFNLEKSYETTPGYLNFHQQVNRWVMELKD